MYFLDHIKKKLQLQHGQHVLEYCVLLTLIMVGIITMNHYVVRSWNANLKGWEDSVIDSQEDPLARASYTMPGCQPGAWNNLQCNLTNYPDPCGGTAISCTPREMGQERTFSPVDCQCGSIPTQPSIRCMVDDCCCDAYTPTGLCGSNAIDRGGGSVPACNNQGMIPKIPGPGGDCPPGWEEASTVCGGDATVQWGCVLSAACAGECRPPANIDPVDPAYQDIGSGWCPEVNPTDIPASGFAYIRLVNQGQCSVARFCEWQCATGYRAFTSGTSQVCGPCPSVNVIKSDLDNPGTLCPPNEFWLGHGAPSNCGPKQFLGCCN